MLFARVTDPGKKICVRAITAAEAPHERASDHGRFGVASSDRRWRGRRRTGLRWLVSPLYDDRIDELVVTMGATEDDEPNGAVEPSIGPHNDLESDGDCDAEEDDPGGGNVEDEGELDLCDDEEDRVERWVPV